MLLLCSCPATRSSSGSNLSHPSRPAATRQSRALAEQRPHLGPSLDCSRTQHSKRSPRTLRNARRWHRQRSRAHSIRDRRSHRARQRPRQPDAAAPTTTRGRSYCGHPHAPTIHRGRKAGRDDVCWQFLACVELAKSENRTHHDSKTEAQRSRQQASIWQSRDP